MPAKKTVTTLLKQAGITVNGSKPWDLQVKNDQFYARALSQGSLGLGDSYVDGWWECKRLDQFFHKLLRAQLHEKIKPLSIALQVVKAKLVNLQSKKRAFQVGERHYDIGNDIYEAMLDKRLTYTCAYWKHAKNLDHAQEAKLDLVCKKLGLKPGMSVLDIGCGWGSFLKYAAENYGITGVGNTVSKEQAKHGNKLCKGLPVKIKLQDYRDHNGSYDRIVSLGMFEHVGPKNYRAFMNAARRNLKDDGLFLLHTIGTNETTPSIDPWINKHIFPNGKLPSIKQIAKSIEKRFIMEDWHNFGADYDKTLMAWHRNFTTRWNTLKDKYGERFKRLWSYYLLSCAGSFRARNIQLWQIVLSKNGVDGGYRSVR